MQNLKLDLIKTLENESLEKNIVIEPKKTAFKSKKKKLFRLIAVFLIACFFLFTRGIITENTLITEVPKISFWKGMVKIIIFQENLLKGEMSGRTNILLLGRSGENHDGPDLTDTIILASLKPSTNELALLSIPRDLWIEIPDYGFAKINAANAYGKERGGNGSLLTTSIVSNLLNLPIHYFINIDFDGFKEIIDALGSIEINVEKSFTDLSFPGPNFTYRIVSFEKGLQKMTGSKALDYARSRHGNNDEDSDFARMKRQQKILSAIKEKIKEIKILQEPQKILSLFYLFQKYFQTNLGVNQIVKLTKSAVKIKEEAIITKTFSIGENQPLYEDYYNGAYILKTKTGDFSELAAIAQNIFNKEKVGNLKQKPKIIVLNGTNLDGLAKTEVDLLVRDFEILETGNAPTRNYDQTIIYDLTDGDKNKELENLKNKLGAKIVSQELPQDFIQKQADFIIILGKK